jgi:hypothetical protein
VVGWSIALLPESSGEALRMKFANSFLKVAEISDRFCDFLRAP